MSVTANLTLNNIVFNLASQLVSFFYEVKMLVLVFDKHICILLHVNRLRLWFIDHGLSFVILIENH